MQQSGEGSNSNLSIQIPSNNQACYPPWSEDLSHNSPCHSTLPDHIITYWYWTTFSNYWNTIYVVIDLPQSLKNSRLPFRSSHYELINLKKVITFGKLSQLMSRWLVLTLTILLSRAPYYYPGHTNNIKYIVNMWEYCSLNSPAIEWSYNISILLGKHIACIKKKEEISYTMQIPLFLIFFIFLYIYIFNIFVYFLVLFIGNKPQGSSQPSKVRK